MTKKILLITIISILTLSIISGTVWFILSSNKPKDNSENVVTSSSNSNSQNFSFPDDRVDNSIVSSPKTSTSSSSQAYQSSRSNLSQTNSKSVANSVGSKDTTVSSVKTSSASIVVSQEQKIILDNTKFTFKNNDKLVYTDKLIPSSTPIKIVPTSELQYPQINSKNIYISTSDSVYSFGDGVVGVYEVSDENRFYRIVQTADITGFSKLFATDQNFKNPKRIYLEIEGLQLGNLKRINNNVFEVTAVEGQKVMKVRKFQIDLFKAVESQIIPM